MIMIKTKVTIHMKAEDNADVQLYRTKTEDGEAYDVLNLGWDTTIFLTPAQSLKFRELFNTFVETDYQEITATFPNQ